MGHKHSWISEENETSKGTWNKKHPILLFHVAVAIPAQSKILSRSKIETHILSTSLPFIRASYEEWNLQVNFFRLITPLSIKTSPERASVLTCFRATTSKESS